MSDEHRSDRYAATSQHVLYLTNLMLMITVHLSLLRAATSGDLKTLKELLGRGARTDVTDEQGRTCLFEAVNARRKAVVEELLRFDADVNITNKDGWSPLRQATSEALTDIAAILIGAGANVHLRDSETGQCCTGLPLGVTGPSRKI